MHGFNFFENFSLFNKCILILYIDECLFLENAYRYKYTTYMNELQNIWI